MMWSGGYGYESPWEKKLREHGFTVSLVPIELVIHPVAIEDTVPRKPPYRSLITGEQK